MTNPAGPPASRVPGPDILTQPLGRRQPSTTRHTVDIVLATLLTIGLVGVAAYSAIGLSLGIAMSGDGCHAGSGEGCVSSGAAYAAWLIAMALLLIALVVGCGGLIVAATKHRVLSWWPLAGYPVVVAAWLTAIVIVG